MAPGTAVRRTRRSIVGAAGALVSVAVAGAVAAVEHAVAGPPPSRHIGDSRVVAQLPEAPGYPEGVAVLDERVYVATAARFGTSVVPPKGPPEVQVFDRRTGELLARHIVDDVDARQDHGLSGVAFDARGRLYVLSTQWGVVRFDPAKAPTAPKTIDPRLKRSDGSSLYLYAEAFPDLLPCPLADPCSPGSTSAPPLPNDLAFDAAGDLYVTDSLQATIWRVPPPARPGQASTPEVWLQDERLSGAFGPNGIRFDGSGSVLYLTVTADRHGAGHLYSIDVGETPVLTAIRTYPAAEVIDNLAFGHSGLLYVALAGTNQIQVLEPSNDDELAPYHELARYSGPATRADGSSVPYDMPSGVALDSATKSLLVNNHSEILGKADHFVVFDVFVNDWAEPLIRPVVP